MGPEALSGIVDALALVVAWLIALPLLVFSARRYRPSLVGWTKAFLYIGAVCTISIATIALLRPLITGQGVPGVDRPLTAVLLRDVDRNLIIALATISLALAADRFTALGMRNREYVAARRDLTAQRLRALEAQLHPHFLFNTLHAIVALLQSDTKRATDLVSRIKSLLMEVLRADERVEVALGEEIQLTQAYLEIQKVRFPEILRTAVSLEPDLAKLLVPRMLLQPIVENAVRHGLAGTDRVGLVEVFAVRQNDDLIIFVRDNGRGIRSGQTPAWIEGVGLSNTRRRIHDLYGSAYDLTLADSTEGCTVSLRLPARLQSVLADNVSAASAQPGPTPLRWRRLFPALLAITLGVAAFWLFLSLMYERVDGAMYTRSSLITMALVQAAIMAIVACIIAAIAWQLPLSSRDAALSAVANGFLPLLAVAIHLSLDALVRFSVNLPSLHLGPLVVFDGVAAIAVVGTVYQHRFRRQARAIEVAVLEVERERNEVLHAIRRVQLNPLTIGQWLDAVSDVSRDSPRDAGDLIVAIGDYLRWVVLAAPNARVRLTDDLAMLHAWERASDLAARRTASSRHTELPASIAHVVIPSCLLPAIAAEVCDGQPLDLELGGDPDNVRITIRLGGNDEVISARERLAEFLPSGVSIETPVGPSSSVILHVSSRA